MKNIFFLVFVTAATVFSFCNDGTTKSEHEGHDMNNDTARDAIVADDSEIKTVQAVFSNTDAKAAGSIKEIVDHYLHVKNALAGDNASEAAAGAKEMEKVISNLDKSLLTAEQKVAYDKSEEEIKTLAGEVVKHSGNIKEQRSRFVQLSEIVYGLVKNFGGGRPLYHDHCPMARDNQGAMWISEVKEIKNPYFGSGMPECGTVEEMIK